MRAVIRLLLRARTLALFLLLVLVFESAPISSRAATIPSVDQISSGIINRSIPGGETLTSGNANLRQPSQVELQARERVRIDLPAIRRGIIVQKPVKSRSDISNIGKRLSDLRKRMKKEGATAALMTAYAEAISPL